MQQISQRPIKQSFCVSLRRDAHWKCLILTLLIYGCLAAITWCRLAVITTVIVYYNTYISQREVNQSSPCADGYIYIPVAFVILLYLVYLVECWHCHTRIELRHKVDVTTVYHKIRQMREAFPIIWWKAICYHYVRRSRQVTRYRNGDAFTTTQVYYERVNSHTGGCAFNFTNCGVQDMSKIITGLEDYPATKIRFSKSFSFLNPESQCEFDDQRSRFFQENERRDDYMETREGMDLLNVNFREYMIAFSDPDHLPWYVSHVIFWIASSLLLSWPLRVIIEFKTAYIHYHVHKLFGSNYANQENSNGQMTRVNTMASSELEMNIRNNFSVVPSYSEALLMDANATSSHTLHDANANVTSPVLGPTRSITWNNFSTSSSNGYIRGFFSTCQSQNILPYRSCSVVNGGAIIQNEIATEDTGGRRRNSPSASNRPSPWRKKRKRGCRSGESSSNTMFVLASPETPDEYSLAIDERLSSVRLSRNYSSDELRRVPASTVISPSSYSLQNSTASGPQSSSSSGSKNSKIECTSLASPQQENSGPAVIRPTSLNNPTKDGTLFLRNTAQKSQSCRCGGTRNPFESPPGYEEALRMQSPFVATPLPPVRLLSTPQSTLRNTSEQEQLLNHSGRSRHYHTIMETSL